MNLSFEYKNILQEFFSDKPVIKAYLFGSFARDEAKNTSDLDILLELDYENPIRMKFFGFEPALEKLLKRKVDIITNNGLSEYIKPFIDKDKILIYERVNN